MQGLEEPGVFSAPSPCLLPPPMSAPRSLAEPDEGYLAVGPFLVIGIARVHGNGAVPEGLSSSRTDRLSGHGSLLAPDLHAAVGVLFEIKMPGWMPGASAGGRDADEGVAALPIEERDGDKPAGLPAPGRE